MRTLAILITALLAVGAAIELARSVGATPAPSILAAGAVLAIATVVGGVALWGGARWGALLVLIAALLGAFMAQADHTPLVFGPIAITSRPYAVWGCFLAVALLVALSWRGLGKRSEPRRP